MEQTAHIIIAASNSRKDGHRVTSKIYFETYCCVVFMEREDTTFVQKAGVLVIR